MEQIIGMKIHMEEIGQNVNLKVDFIPYKQVIQTPLDGVSLGWEIVLTGFSELQGEENPKVSIGDFTPLSEGAPETPYGDILPIFNIKEIVEEDRLIWTITGPPLAVTPPQGEEYVWAYTVHIGNDQHTLQKIDPLVVISG